MWQGASRLEQRVKRQPGLLEYQTVVDRDDPNKYVVITRWSSKKHLRKWFDDPWYVCVRVCVCV